MKKTTWTLAILYVLFNTSLAYTAPGDNKIEKEQSIVIRTSNCAYKSHFVQEGKTFVKIDIHSSNCSTNEVHIPTSVKKIDLQGALTNCSKLILYTRHDPEINDNTSCHNCAQVQIMHPIRQYTYHVTAIVALAALAYYFTSES